VATTHHPRRRVERAAALLAKHRLSGRAFPGFPEEDTPRDAGEAYEVQAALHAELAPAFGQQAGWKIGCTTATMQAYLGIAEPAAGHIRSHQVHTGTVAVRHDEFVRPGVECELAVRLGRDLARGDEPCDRATARAAIAGVLAAIEIVDDRYADWSALGAPSLTADDFFGAGCVLGREDVPWRELDLSAVAATMRVNDEEIGSGVGADILGDPLAALVWLVNGPAGAAGLPAGSIVLLGSVVQTHWVEPGDVVTVENVPFGQVSVAFTR
jgi:2-oxo-3-hexenedioate decarboxylase/2-keto-4-pentenoate hydratase